MIAFALSSPKPEEPIVDILIDPPINMPDALARVVYRDLGGGRVALASIEDMITLKIKSGRVQDLADVEHLEQLVKSMEE